MNNDTKNAIQKYKILIQKLLNREISAGEFERVYMKTFQNEKVSMEDEIFFPLDWLFAEAECYTGLPRRPDEDPGFHVTEEQLRKSAAEVLKKLQELETGGRAVR